MKNNIPLIVDLDGTLLKTDSLHESFLGLIKNNFLFILLSLFWILRGKVYFKNKINTLIKPNITNAPFNYTVIDFCEKESKKRDVFLVTGASHHYAKKVADKFKFFKSFKATTTQNLTGKNKLNFLVNKFGKFEFDYIGNSFTDLIIWKNASKSYVCGNISWLLKFFNKDLIQLSSSNPLRVVFRSLRIHQWIKNILIFSPIIFSHRFFEINLYISALYGFIFFSLTASSIYILNDINDLDSDRIHPSKKDRPFASGDLSILSGIIISIFLVIISLLASFKFDINLFWLLIVYIFSTSIYTLFLKHIAFLDCIFLSYLYTLRVFAGGVLLGIPLTNHFLLFNICTFLSLAFIKRSTDFLHPKNSTRDKLLLNRGYVFKDFIAVLTFGIAMSVLSVFVLFDYLTSNNFSIYYQNIQFIFIIIFLLIYLFCYLWSAVLREKMYDDPIKFLLTDNKAQIIIFFIILAYVLSIF